MAILWLKYLAIMSHNVVGTYIIILCHYYLKNLLSASHIDATGKCCLLPKPRCVQATAFSKF